MSVGFRDMGVFSDPGKKCPTGFIEADTTWEWVGEGGEVRK